MQQPLLTQSQPHPLENRCPICLSMKLEGTAVEPDQIDLYLTINFNEQCEHLTNGNVRFGLKGGKLKLRLENGKIPYELRELTSSVELFIQEQRQESEASKTQGRVAASASEGQAGTKVRIATEQSESRIARFSTCQVTTKGSPQYPAWIFAVENEPILKGSLNNMKLATLKVIALPCFVEATFEVSLRDVYITETDRLWSQSINKNQLAVLKRGIASFLLKQKLQPYLSQVELRYE